MTLSKSDLIVVEGEPRVACGRLSEALGFNRVNDLHRLIRANEDELQDFGGVLCFEAKNPSPKGGRPQVVFHLNESQAVAITMWANTAQARAGRRLIIEVFTAWRKGEAQPAAPAADPFAVQAERAAHIATHLTNLAGASDLLMRLTNLPIWRNGRRPVWWHDFEVREFLTVTHRQMALHLAEREGRRRFGDRCPGLSAIGRYWQRLDAAFGPSALPRPAKSKKEAA